MESRANWKAFATGDMAARDVLLTENLSLVHHVARQLERKLSNELDHDELVSAGTLGLMAAMNSFDPDARSRVQHVRRAAHSRRDSRRAPSTGPRAALGASQDARHRRGALRARGEALPHARRLRSRRRARRRRADAVEVGVGRRRRDPRADRPAGQRSRRRRIRRRSICCTPIPITASTSRSVASRKWRCCAKRS